MPYIAQRDQLTWSRIFELFQMRLLRRSREQSVNKTYISATALHSFQLAPSPDRGSAVNPMKLLHG